MLNEWWFCLKGFVLFLLKIVTILLWVMTTVIGSLIFYNVHAVNISWDVSTTTHPQLEVKIKMSITYSGYLLDIEINITIFLYDNQSRVVGRATKLIYLKPGETKTNVEMAIILTGIPTTQKTLASYSEYLYGYNILNLRTESQQAVKLVR